MTWLKTWLREQWFWLKWALLAAAMVVGYTIVARRLAKRVRQISQPTTWQPLGDNAVAVLNPATGAFEVVALPDDVKTDDVIAVGITEETGNYEVATVHTATDRHGPAGSNSDFGL